MNFLEKVDFSIDTIAELEESVPYKLQELLNKQKKLVILNINCLKDLNITNIEEIFIKYYDMFLMDNSNFMEVFNKYDLDDLINKINQNKNIVEYL